MFEFKKLAIQPIYYLNYKIPCLITLLTKSAIRKTTRKKNKQQGKQKQIFLANVLKEEKKKHKY